MRGIVSLSNRSAMADNKTGSLERSKLALARCKGRGGGGGERRRAPAREGR